jgi:dipeptidyl aminopeptidase/acylaminoacyl peptidase
MITNEQVFYSEGSKIKGALYLPDNFKEGEKRPCIIPNSGYMGLRTIYPELFAHAFTARGYICFGFNYRGFVDSEGPAGVCLLDGQVQDIRNAYTFVKALPEVDPDNIGILGWAMAAPLVTAAAVKEKGIKAVAGLNGFYNGERWLRAVHSYVDFKRLKQEMDNERTRFVQEGTRRFSQPFYFYPLDPATSDVVTQNLYKVSGYGQEISLELGQSILEFCAESLAPAIDTPMFIAHGKYNFLHPVEESLSMYEALGGEKELVLLEGKHNDFMFDDHPVFHELINKLIAFYGKYIGKP